MLKFVILIFIIIFFSIESSFSQELKGKDTIIIENADSNLNEFTIKHIKGDWLVYQKTFRANRLLRELYFNKNMDTLYHIHYFENSSQIGYIEFFYIPQNALKEFTALHDYHWSLFNFLVEYYNIKGKIIRKKFYKKYADSYHINEAYYHPYRTEEYKNGHLKECFEFIQMENDHSSYQGHKIKCK